jgi:hypothetical protein
MLLQHLRGPEKAHDQRKKNNTHVKDAPC